MKKFFNIAAPYQFEWNDLRALTLFLNFLLILIFGFTASWFGLAIAVFGIIKDFTNPQRHFNEVAMHCTSACMNLYFLYLLYMG